MRRIYGERTDYPIEKLADSVYRINEFYCANTYLFVGSSKALLVDLGTGIGDLRGKVREITELPIEVVATHAHVDHIGGGSQFDQVYVHEDDICKFNKLQSKLLVRKIFFIFQAFNPYVRKFHPSVKDVKDGGHKTIWVPITDGEEFDLGNKKIKVKHTPGHTLGSIALIDEEDKIMVIGDNISPATWMFLPHATTVEEWLPTAFWLKDMIKDYKLYWGHIEGEVTEELIDKAIGYAQEVLKKKNSIFNGIKGYPKFDQLGSCFVYNPKKIHKKKK